MRLIARVVAFALVVGTRAAGAQAQSGSPDPFTYQTGWPQSCSTGMQSPITFVGASTTSRSYSVVDSSGTPSASVAPDNHTAEFVFRKTGAGSMRVGSSTYTLESFHLHFPVEHQLPNVGMNGPAMATLELHVKTKDAGGRYAVFGVQFVATDAGSRVDSDFFASIIRGIPLIGTDSSIQIPMSGVLALFTKMPFYSYVGTTTSPNCDPNVMWYVLHRPMPVKKSLVEEIHAALEAKGLNATNARFVSFNGPPHAGIAIVKPKP